MSLFSNNNQIGRALNRAFIGASGLALAGCSTTMSGACMKGTGINIGLVGVQSSKFDHDCNVSQIARGMMQVQNDGVQAAALKVLGDQEKRVGDANAAVVQAMVNPSERTMTYVANPDGQGGKFVFDKPIVTVQQTPQSATPPAKKAAAAVQQPAPNHP